MSKQVKVVGLDNLDKFKGKIDENLEAKADKSEIPTSLPASGGNANTVNNHTVKSDVPENAKFTDTVYTHPTSSGNKHIPSGGSSGQILRWSADGTATWGADNNTTYSNATTTAAGLMSAADKTKLDGIDTGANNYTYTLPAATSSVRGGVKIGYTANGKNYPVQLSNEQMYVNVPWTDTNTTYSNMTAATASAAGTSGLVPAPAAGSQAKYLRGDGTWQTPPDTNTTYGNASTSAAGLVSTGTQTFAGNKTFNGQIIPNGASACGTLQARKMASGTAAATSSNCPSGAWYGQYE